MTAKDLKKKYLEFFKKKDHAIIPSSSLIPENDPTVLFTTAGMQPLVPYLLGEPHPEGKRLADVQKCLRTDDIDEVGDTSHHTFFEMLGNWSLGDPASPDGVGQGGYWKEESISWSYEFLTKELGIERNRLWISCFAGDKDAPKDSESAEIWMKLGIGKDRIFYYGKGENWWGPAGETGPCGPDTEIFYDTSRKPHSASCKPGDNCGRFFEIWNNVFMEYNKIADGKYEPLKQKNVDTGMGVDRTVAVLSGLDDDYLVKDLWGEIIASIEELSKTKYSDNKKAYRIIADHVRAVSFAISDGVEPSNKGRGYVLRRLIRRAVRYSRVLGSKDVILGDIAKTVSSSYGRDYPELKENDGLISEILKSEESKFIKTIEKGLKEISKFKKIDAKKAFFLYETYGFPLELTEEIAKEMGQKVDKNAFEKEFKKHQDVSRSSSGGMFKGGLADHSEEVTKLHTATHLLHAALRKILGESVSQKGSNITNERLRFDISYPKKLTEKEIKSVEDLVNDQIEKDLPVTYKTMALEEAIKEGALHFFGDKYPSKVKVYTIGKRDAKWFSKEVCGGPHVTSTGKIGRVRIKKQEKVGEGVLRIYATIGS